jgi:hypothetical protein
VVRFDGAGKPVPNSLPERRERRRSLQRAGFALGHRNVHEADPVRQPQHHVAQASGLAGTQFGQDVLGQPLVLVGGFRSGLVTNHDGSAHHVPPLQIAGI